MSTDPSSTSGSQPEPSPASSQAGGGAAKVVGSDPSAGTRKPGGRPAAPGGAGRLDAEAIAGRMKALPEWTLSGEAIQRTLRFADFVVAMEFVDRIAEIAEQQGHHPDILIRYNKVTLTLSTHDAGGITAKDFTLAEAIEKIVPR